MITVPGIYKGNRQIELKDDVELPSNTSVYVLLPTEDDEQMIKKNLQMKSEEVFKKMWNNEQDEVWNEYL